MSIRKPSPKLQATVNEVLELTAAHTEAARARREAIRKAKRDLFQLRDTDKLPPAA